jgi:hypothetical protein
MQSETMIKYFKLGRIFAANITEAMDMLGPGVVSLKPCPVQFTEKIWYEYVLEVGAGDMNGKPTIGERLHKNCR